MWRVRALAAVDGLTGPNDTGELLHHRIEGSTCDALLRHSLDAILGAASPIAAIRARRAASRCRAATGGATSI